MAHRLSDLHTSPEHPTPNIPVFDKVLVITDRTVLDDQLQETIGDFQQTNGLVIGVGGKGGAKSAQLADALAQETGKIVIVTLQTFPALLAYLRREPAEIRGSRFAIIVDEAHSSQTGEAATDVKRALRDLGLDADDEESGASSISADAVDAEATPSAPLPPMTNSPPPPRPAAITRTSPTSPSPQPRSTRPWVFSARTTP
ncbi:DEAD/DEAH box helicase family protein [Streptomyces indonesiensis]